MNLPPMNPVPAMDLDQFNPGERAVSIRACENHARLYGAAVQEACARVCEAVAFDGCHEWRKEAVDMCAAAIRNGVIREGEEE